MSQDYEDKRYLYLYQEEMDKEKGTLLALNDRGHASSIARGRDTPTYIYELVEVVIPRAYEGEVIEDKEQKRPIKVTYV